MTAVLAKRVQNVSNVPVKVDMGCATLTLNPGSSIQDIEVHNLSEIRGKVKISEDLTEVKRSSGKTILNDRRE